MKCQSCKKNFSFFERLISQHSGYCNKCFEHIQGVIRSCENTIEREFETAGITSEIEKEIFASLEKNFIIRPYADKLIQRMNYLKAISEIRFGNINPIFTNTLLKNDEKAYFEIPGMYCKPLKNVQFISGSIVGTDQRIIFISSTGKDSFAIQLDNIATVQILNNTIVIQTIKSRGGTYQVADPLFAKTYIDVLAKRWKMQIIIQREQSGSRLIPENIRIQVLQKYNNRCAFCGASGYDNGVGLEMDHIIPFSRGGQSIFENLQPLCGPCNKKKGNRL